MKFLVMNGVNLNLTGKREKGVYGTATLEEINEKIAAYCNAGGDSVDFYQSNLSFFLFCDRKQTIHYL